MFDAKFSATSDYPNKRKRLNRLNERKGHSGNGIGIDSLATNADFYGFCYQGRICTDRAEGRNGCYELTESIAKLPYSKINAPLF